MIFDLFDQTLTDEDGTVYHCTRRLEKVTIENRETIFHFEGFEVVNQCDKCRRFDARPLEAHGIDEAIAKGLVTL